MILPKMKAFKLSVDVINNNKKLGKFRLTGYSLACSRETFVSSRYFFFLLSEVRLGNAHHVNVLTKKWLQLLLLIPEVFLFLGVCFDTILIDVTLQP